jgi:hypothetical protein
VFSRRRDERFLGSHAAKLWKNSKKTVRANSTLRYTRFLMLDALKFAFEVLVVGALALPWLAVLSRMFLSDHDSSLAFYLSVVPKAAQSAVAVAIVIAFGYLLGSAVSRISRNFFNDELWKSIPTEYLIRDAVYTDVYCKEHIASELNLPYIAKTGETFGFCPNSYAYDTPEKFRERVGDLFRLQESALLLQGQDKVDRLKQYFDQITILRGATFNAFILFAVCAFGMCGNLKVHWSGHRIFTFAAYLPACVVILLGFYWLHGHLSDLPDNLYSFYSRPPLTEFVFLLLGLLGVLIVFKADKITPYFRTCILAAVVTLISFGGWWWTEILYDTQVIHSKPTLSP